jgi:hypothetical protein
MRALLAVVLLALGCASQGVAIDEDFRSCDDARDVSIAVALSEPRSLVEGSVEALTMMVEVDNHDTSDIEVMAIRVEPGPKAHDRYRLERSYRKFDRVIAPRAGDAFELPVSGSPLPAPATGNLKPSDTLEVVVSVYLKGGDTYRCEFSVPSPPV